MIEQQNVRQKKKEIKNPFKMKAENLVYMSKKDFDAMSRKDYKEILEDERVLEFIALICFYRHGLKEQLQKGPEWQKAIEDIKTLIYNCDKHMFYKFKEKEITKNQLEARLIEFLYGVRFKCLDDFKEILGPQVGESSNTNIKQLEQFYGTVNVNGKKTIPIKNMIRELNPWEVDEHCVRSLYSNKHKNRSQTAKAGKFAPVGNSEIVRFKNK